MSRLRAGGREQKVATGYPVFLADPERVSQAGNRQLCDQHVFQADNWQTGVEGIAECYVRTNWALTWRM